MAITASISLKENSYSVANNTSSVTCKVTVHWTYSSNDRNNTTKTLTFNGSKFTTTTNINSSVTSSGSMTLFNKTLTVAHNSDGTKTVSASVRIPTSTSSGTVTASKSLTLTNIPRYATISQSLYSKTENAIRINWNANVTIDYAWFSKNDGESWTGVDVADGTSGTYVFNGLTANTTYKIKTRVRRKDSQLTTDSTALSVATYNYPYCTSAPNFTIGDKLTLGFYNPLGRTFQFYIIANGQSIANNPWTISGTSYSGIDATSTQEQLYSTIPNTRSATYQVKCVYGSSEITKTGGTLSANASVASPSFSGGTYEDTNSSTVAITGDNQEVIPTKSTLKFDISGITTKYNASVSGARVTLNGTNYPMTISGTDATVSNVPLNSSGQNATITLTDSRGLTYSKPVALDIVEYTAPSISATAERDSGFYSETDITPTVNYTSIGTNAVTLNLKARKVGTTTYTIDQTIPDGTTTQVVLDNEYAWEILLTATDSLGGVGTYNITLARGIPLMYFDTELLSTGVNKFPEHSEAFEVGGDLYINGKTKVKASGNDSISLESGNTNENVMIEAKRTDTGTTVRFGVGTGGVNHGVWSDPLDKWLVYTDGQSIGLGSTLLGSLFVRETRNTAHNVPAGGTQWISFDVTKAGYTPLAVVGYYVQGTWNTTINIYHISLSGNTASMALYNPSSSASNGQVTAHILYLKTSFE